MQREALMSAVFDSNRTIPVQVWYDSLRETDDGRFSSSVVGKHHNRKYENLIDRPFNSTHRTYFTPVTSGSLVFARSAVIDKKDRTGGYMGQDQHYFAAKLGGKDPVKAAFRPKKLNVNSSLYGNPNILLVNKSATNSPINQLSFLDKVENSEYPKVIKINDSFGNNKSYISKTIKRNSN